MTMSHRWDGSDEAVEHGVAPDGRPQTAARR